MVALFVGAMLCSFPLGVRADMRPVWQLVVDSSGVARVVVNEFRVPGHRRRFPLHELIVRRFVDRSEPRPGGGTSPSFGSDIARLGVRADGTLDSNGKIVFDTTASSVDPEVVRSNTPEPSLPIERGTGPRPVVSADGTTALVLIQEHPGRLQLFDLRGLNAVPVGPPLETDADMLDAVVSGDGQVVAVRVLERGSNSKSRVVALDRRLRPRAILMTDTSPPGLRFEKRLLFVGSQIREAPTGYFFMSTREIRLFDLGRLPSVKEGRGVDFGL